MCLTEERNQRWLGQCNRNERDKGGTMMLQDRGFLIIDETSNRTGASPSSSIEIARLGTGRMLS